MEIGKPSDRALVLVILIHFHFCTITLLFNFKSIGPRKDPCFERRNALDLSVCEVCDHHLCNGSTNVRKSSWAIALSMAAAIIFKKFL